MTHNRTTIGGLLSSIGKGLTGASILPQLTQLAPNSNVIPPTILAALWWVTLVGVILGVVGTALTAFFAADAAEVNNVAAAVDKINQTGPSTDTQLLAKPTEPPKPT